MKIKNLNTFICTCILSIGLFTTKANSSEVLLEPVAMEQTAFFGVLPETKKDSNEEIQVFEINALRLYYQMFKAVDFPSESEANFNSKLSAYYMQEAVRGYFLAGGNRLLLFRSDSLKREDYQVAVNNASGFGQIALTATPGLSEVDEVLSVEVQNLLFENAQEYNRRFVVIDSPNTSDFIKLKGFKANLDSEHGAMYAGWPIYKDRAGIKRALPPSGIVAGTFVKTLMDSGIHKSIANRSLPVLGVEQSWNDKDIIELNRIKINPITTFSGIGSVIWGSKTLSSKSSTETKYISVVRLSKFVKESINSSLDWVYSSPNNGATWQRIQTLISHFLTDLWRTGALSGATPSDSFYSLCGLNITMTAQDILEGKIIVEYGIAAIRPAEFQVSKLEINL